jgi:oxygen-independent coproporphyrinogen-3 oxidase
MDGALWRGHGARRRGCQLTRPLRDLLVEGEAFQGYAYAYPHKTAYRQLDPARPLRQAWDHEDKHALFLYAHVPFCEMRCGFCNLFTMTHAGANLVTAYLDALTRQAEAVADALGASAQFARIALGGGTPTFLTVAELERLFGVLSKNFQASEAGIPKAIEASPATLDEEKIALLKTRQFTRVSLGVQSFLEAEVKALGRSQRTSDVRKALAALTAANFACVNIDLIYGIAGQTVESWKCSLAEALEFAPQEIYLYPLYVRPLTHLGQKEQRGTDDRMNLYRSGRDFLLNRGYHQVSMRLFRHASYAPLEGPVYCCQEDGMVGIGAGARSYTTALHYSTDFAVGRPGVLEVITDFNLRTHNQFAFADYGCELDLNEQKRRYVLKSLLRRDGLDCARYCASFFAEVLFDFPQLDELVDEGLASQNGDHLRLTSAGLGLSDVIGPWLWSSAMREKMNEFALR